MLKVIFSASILLALANFVYSQEPPKAPQVEPKQQPESGLKAKDNRKQTITRAPQPLSIGPKIATKGADWEGQGEAEERGQQGTEFWPPLYGYGLKVTDTLLVSITFLLFLATFALWLSTRRLVRGAEETAERQLRAYVSVLGIQRSAPPGAALRYFEAKVEIKNCGQTPAYAFSQWTVIIIREFPLKTAFPPHHIQCPSISVLGPGASALSLISLPREISLEQEIAIIAEQQAIYIWGEIAHRDAFNRERFTKFRFRCNGHGYSFGGFKPCEEGNDAN